MPSVLLATYIFIGILVLGFHTGYLLRRIDSIGVGIIIICFGIVVGAFWPFSLAVTAGYIAGTGKGEQNEQRTIGL